VSAGVSPVVPAERGAVREVSTLAQAKVNLFLRVLARETSGYHQLETLFQRLELGDEVRVRVGVPGRSLECGGADLGPTERNLAWRAALAYVEATGWPDGFAIEIAKRIPTGAGLGGGSADAGAVLRCLNALAPRPLSPNELLALGAPLGADVPFLTAEVPLALAWGRGERMFALPTLPARRVHLALFGEGVSTAEAYAALAEREPTARRVRPIVWTPERLTRWDDVALIATNDFEDVIFPLREDIAAVRRMFGEVTRRVDALHQSTEPEGATVGGDTGDTAPIALMTGSGATVCLLTPLDGVEVTFEVRGPDDEDDALDEEPVGSGEDEDTGVAEETWDRAATLPGLAIVETRTAVRVAPVKGAG
jgi:4-diphosphocytidyl-2-C-methyl-D-erythritol kinase